MPVIEKVISGGQLGVDQLGLLAAESCKIATGGTAPAGYRTVNGSAPSLRKFGLVEHRSPSYPPRTEANVKDSDGTIRFANDFNSRGEKCTLKFLKKHNKPYFDVDLNFPSDVINAIDFIRKHDIKVLNIAGNVKITQDEMLYIYSYLTYLFDVVNKK